MPFMPPKDVRTFQATSWPLTKQGSRNGILIYLTLQSLSWSDSRSVPVIQPSYLTTPFPHLPLRTSLMSSSPSFSCPHPSLQITCDYKTSPHIFQRPSYQSTGGETHQLIVQVHFTWPFIPIFPPPWTDRSSRDIMLTLQGYWHLIYEVPIVFSFRFLRGAVFAKDSRNCTVNTYSIALQVELSLYMSSPSYPYLSGPSRAGLTVRVSPLDKQSIHV